MKLYNTRTRQIEELKPKNGNIIKMYTCGPTVYHFAHIGNLRTYISEDVLEKGLKYLGYPGWHIECSGISIEKLGDYLDIHCGAEDAVFPHHTNEIAQSEAYLGHDWCDFWVHMGFLNDKGGKMSKSRGEFLTVSLLEEKGYNPLSYRYLCLNSYYHNQLTFSYEILDGAENAYLKLKRKIASIKDEGELNNDKITSYINKFKEAISNDLNSSNMITLLYDVLKDEKLSGKSKLYLVEDFDKVLSLDLISNDEENSQDDSWIIVKIEERRKAVAKW